MRNNRRVYRTIRQAIKQLYPGELKGDTARMLTTLANASGRSFRSFESREAAMAYLVGQ